MSKESEPFAPLTDEGLFNYLHGTRNVPSSSLFESTKS